VAEVRVLGQTLDHCLNGFRFYAITSAMTGDSAGFEVEGYSASEVAIKNIIILILLY
jgi:hypothetical protein